MAEQGDWISVIKGVIQRMAATGVSELEVRQGDLRLKLRRAPELASHPPVRAMGGDTPTVDPEGHHRVLAPLTGIYYSAPNPSSKPYVSVGDWLEHDSVVGLIETMKVFNEVVADCRGRVVALLVQAGQLVHAGDPILLVDVTATPDHAGEVAS